MATALNLRRLLHRPQFELCNPNPVASAAGMYSAAIQEPTFKLNLVFNVTNKDTAIYEFDPALDSEILLPTTGATGTFGAGACGCVHPMGPTGTATAGTTTTITTNLTIVRDLRGFRVRITAGTNAGQTRIIASNTVGANAVITVADAYGSAIDNTSVYQLITPRLWVFCPPTATQSLTMWDYALSAWTAKVGSGVTMAGTDAVMLSTASILGNRLDAADCNGNAFIATSTANGFTLAAPLTSVPPALGNSGRNWVVNEWAGAIVHIVSGTGVGQTRHIVSNTSNAVTVDVNWTTQPDATSIWQITKAFASSGSNGVSFVSCTTTLLTVAGVNWASGQWVNCQLRAVAGTGAGQIRTITASSATTVTVAAMTAFDATTIWVIEGNDDFLYIAGNGAVALFRYSITSNTWSTLSPGTARPAAPSTGMSMFWVTQVQDSGWINENAKKNGRYLYSFRGGASAALDVYDIAANNWAAAPLTYGNQQETFTTGCQWAYAYGRYVVVNQAVTGRYFYYDILLNCLAPLGEHMFVQGAALVGNRMTMLNYKDGSLAIPIVYHWMNTTTSVVRCLLWNFIVP